jgi:hypothetical protein
VRDHRTITRIGQELRARIGDCRTRVPAAFTALRFSLTEIRAADETVGYTFELPPVRGLSATPPEIGSCEIARVDAVVVRACALISNNRLPQDTALAGITRGMLEPVLQQARAAQNR